MGPGLGSPPRLVMRRGGLQPQAGLHETPMRITKPATISNASAPQTFERAYIIVGDGFRAGSVKTLPYGIQHSKSRMRVDVIRKPGCDTEYELSLSQELSERGWMFLRDAYEAEGNGSNYDEYMGFIKACHSGRVMVDNMTENQKAQIVPGFPDKLLPEVCRTMAEGRSAIGGDWEPSTGWDDAEGDAKAIPKKSGASAKSAPPKSIYSGDM